MKVTIHDTVIAEADDNDLIPIEGNYYFPPTALVDAALQDSPTPYVCPWKGAARYHNIQIGHHVYRDAAWSYPTPESSAISRVGKDFTDYLAFDQSQVTID